MVDHHTIKRITMFTFDTRLLIILIVTALIIWIIYKINAKVWCKCQTCLVGKTVLITGANSGIGYETAMDLAKRGARVILACRNEIKAGEAKRKIIEETQNGNIAVGVVDLASFKSVRKFAKKIIENESRLDILINNAGVFGLGPDKTEDNLLTVMQVNYLSHFLLTNLLLDLLKKSGASRIINLSSMVAKFAKLNIDRLDHYRGTFSLYANSKLCNIIFTRELAWKLQDSQVTAYSVHPGVVASQMIGNYYGIKRPIEFFCKNCREGAQTSIHVAVKKGLEGFNGEHFEDCKTVSRYKAARSQTLGQLWRKSEEIVNST